VVSELQHNAKAKHSRGCAQSTIMQRTWKGERSQLGWFGRWKKVLWI